MSDPNLHIAEVDIQTDSDAVGVLRILRASLDGTTFSKRLKEAVKAGFKMITAQKDGAAMGVLGYRILYDVCWGKTFYIDDLVTTPELRSTGVGTALLNHAKKLSIELECDHIRLCSGKIRHDAHRFYEANGFEFFSHQFVHPLKKG